MSNAREVLLDPLIDNNPIGLQVLGICSALAVTTKLETAVVMSAAVLFVLVVSEVVVSVLRRQIPASVRIITQLTIIASAVMVADQVRDFLENGNIKNSVNFPALSLERTEGCYRIALANKNVPRILGSVLSILADRNINVVDMLNKSRDDVAYNLIDIETVPDEELVQAIVSIEGVINVRIFDEVGG